MRPCSLDDEEGFAELDGLAVLDEDGGDGDGEEGEEQEDAAGGAAWGVPGFHGAWWQGCVSPPDR